MQDNEILQQIRRVRDEHARECGGDVRELFTRMRSETKRLQAEGWNVSGPPVEEGSVVRETPPTDGED